MAANSDVDEQVNSNPFQSPGATPPYSHEDATERGYANGIALLSRLAWCLLFATLLLGAGTFAAFNIINPHDYLPDKYWLNMCQRGIALSLLAYVVAIALAIATLAASKGDVGWTPLLILLGPLSAIVLLFADFTPSLSQSIYTKRHRDHLR